MTPGHRVTRFSNCTRETARKRAPWAKAVHKVGSTWVCYESAEDAAEEHGGTSDMRSVSVPGADYRDHFGRIGGPR